MNPRLFAACFAALAVTMLTETGFSQEPNTKPGWWMTPQRMLQTNLREIDATMDTDLYVREVQQFGANVVLFNVGGIVANYPTELPYLERKRIHTEPQSSPSLPKTLAIS